MKNYAWFTLIIPRYSLFYWIKTRLPTTPNLPQQPKSDPNWDRFTATKNSPFSESSCVPKEGLEPSWDCSHHALNVARLPIPPLRLDLLRVEFYLKDGFCQPDENIHTLFISYLPVRNIIYSESYYYMEQNNIVPRHSNIPCMYEMISNISTVRGYNFSNRTRLNRCIWRKECGPCSSSQFQSACSCSLP